MLQNVLNRKDCTYRLELPFEIVIQLVKFAHYLWHDFIRDDGALLLDILLVLFDQAIHALEVLLKNIDLKVLEELIVPL